MAVYCKKLLMKEQFFVDPYFIPVRRIAGDTKKEDPWKIKWFNF